MKTFKICLCVLMACLLLLVSPVQDAALSLGGVLSATELTDDIISASSDGDEQPEEPEPEYYYLDVGSPHKSWDSLLATSGDVVGWINIPGILKGDGYPVTLINDRETGNSYYLHRSLNGSYDSRGTIFMDFRCIVRPDTPLTQNMTLYGHHQKNGEMFGYLRKYKELQYIKQSPIIQFDTIYEPANYLIFSVFITNTLPEHGEIFDYRNPTFETQEDFLEFIKQCRRRSLYNIPVDVQENDTIITLSTCSYEFKDFRLVVMGRKLREGEESVVHVSEITPNPQILYPDVWYRTNGGKKPVYND